jgi:NTE family protein
MMKASGYQNIFLKFFLFAVIITVGLSHSASGQSVGLVLSGGGAKGMAHIGVIRALEEYGIPIDYISGSSIGAMVGGLYASGYTTDEIEMIFSSQRFKQWRAGVVDPEYYYSYMREKSAEMVAVKFKADSLETKAYLPASIVSPHQMDFAFMQILSAPAAASGYDFDSLYIPFRCMATDIHERRAVVFSEGHLPSAIRASMTFPLYFKPIEIDGKLMFDGGIYDNFPKKVMKEDFNPDVIIGVKVASNYGMPDKDDVISQIESMIAGHSDYSLSEDEGILIDIQLDNVKLMDFSSTKAIEERGYNAAMDLMDSISTRVERRISPYARNKARLDFRKEYPKLIFDTIIVEGLKPNQKQYITKLIGIKGEPVGINEIKEQYNKAVASEHIDNMYPIAKKKPGDSFFSLRLPVETAKKFKAGIGGNFSLTDMNQAYLGGSYRFFGRRAYRVNANIYFGSLYNSAQVTGRVYFPVQSQFFTDYTLNFSRKNFTNGKADNFFEDQKSPYIIKNQLFTGLLAGLPLTNNGYAFAGANLAKDMNRYYQRTGFRSDDNTDKSEINYWVGFLGYKYNSLNYRNFAHTGKYFDIRASYINGRENHTPGSTSLIDENESLGFNYFTLKANYNGYFPVSNKLTLGLDASLLLSDKEPLLNYTSTVADAPAYNPFPYASSLFNVKYRAHNYAALGIKTILHFTDDLSFRLEGQIFQPYRKLSAKITGEVISAVYEDPLQYRYFSGRAALVYQTMVGPVYLSYNYFQNYSHDFYLSVGLGFHIFNDNAKMLY